MSSIAQARIIKIGNSQGVRIPKLLLEQVGLSGEVVMEAQDNQIIIRPATRPRQDWDEAFQQMAARGDDQLLDPETATQWDENEWEW